MAEAADWQDEGGEPQQRRGVQVAVDGGRILAALRQRNAARRQRQREREEAWIDGLLGRWSSDWSVQTVGFLKVVCAAGCLFVCSTLVGLHWNFVGRHPCLPATILTHNPDILYIRVARRWGTGDKEKGKENENRATSVASASGQQRSCSRNCTGKFQHPSH